ncbi:uncharacterized protein LOC135159929 [Diachasmimorpha longicaudata]|uniref:uncharacterized protein LOC135159929 n=1 Tax=Diachasmimorpha longicaudata TaxID=58733 RepID=UPI0030B8716C
MANFCNRDLVPVVMRFRGEAEAEDIVFCSAYFPHDSPTQPPTKELRDLNVVWGSESCNDRGTALLEFMADVDLEILNKGSRPTFVTSRCQCIIDITMCTRWLAGRCMDWRVDREDTLSDHRRIRFSIEGCAELQQDRLRRNPRATDWDSFERKLEERLRVGRVRPCREDRLEDEAISRLSSRSRRLWNRACKSKRAEDWTLYRNAQREYKRLIKQSKELTWRTYCEELNALSRVFRLRRVSPAERLGRITLTSGETVTEPREVLEHLVCAHFPGSIIEHPGVCPEAD